MLASGRWEKYYFKVQRVWIVPLSGRTPTRAFLKTRTPDTSQLFPALTVRAVHTLYPLTQSSLKPVWWVFLLPHFKAQEARGEGG